jgi:hypothetical protein
MTEDLIYTFKELINKNDLDAFKAYLDQLLNDYTDIPWDYIFEKVYIHECLKKRKEIADFLTAEYKKMDPIQQIAIRHVFSYGRYLLAH